VIPVTIKLRSRTAMRAGLWLLVPSAGLLVLSESLHALGVLFAASALGGVAGALGYRGSLQLVTELAPEDRRAELVSSYYVVGFSGNAVPVIGVGVLGAASSPMVAHASFGALIALFAIAALILAAVARGDRRA
jgi:MFS family permease